MLGSTRDRGKSSGRGESRRRRRKRAGFTYCTVISIAQPPPVLNDASPTPAHRRPLWLGVLLAPWAAPLTLATVLVLADDRPTATAFVEVLAYALAFGVIPAYAAVLVFGLPWVLWLRARGRLDVLRVVLPAAPAGAIALVATLQALGATLAPLAQTFGGAVLGTSVAAAFCLACGIPWRAAPR